MEKKHTALPWRIDTHLGCIVGPRGDPIHGQSDLSFIVRACNEYDDMKRKADVHDGLVKALEWIATRYDDSKTTAQVAEDAYDMSCVARAALAKAGAA